MTQKQDRVSSPVSKLTQLSLERITADRQAQARFAMSDDAVADYAAAYKSGAELPPIIVFFDGEKHWLAAGFHRLAAAEQAGLKSINVEIRKGDLRDAVLFGVGDNVSHGLRRTNADKRKAVLTLLGDDEWVQWSNRQIASHCAVDDKTVGTIRGELEQLRKIRSFDTRRGADGKERRLPQREVERQLLELPAVAEAQEKANDVFEAVHGPVGFDRVEEDRHEKARLVAANSAEDGGDGDEWYTPQEVLEAARTVLGEIELDPASSPVTSDTVKARRTYTKDDDGLAKTWKGRVFMNPPYSMPLIEQFVDKVVKEHEAGNVQAAVVLVNNCTDTAWFHSLLERGPVCLTRGRLRFWRPDRASFAARQGQAIFYLGKAREAFAQEFAKFGRVVTAL